MLNDLSQQVRDAYGRAHECARKAKLASSEEIRHDYLSLEKHWLDLARSYEVTDRVASFSDEVKRLIGNTHRSTGRSGDNIVPFLRATDDAAFDADVTRLMGEAFDAACQQLGVLSDGEREEVADAILGTAKRGERDPTRLRDAAITAIMPQRR